MVFWKILSFFGSEEFYLLIMPALLWCVNARLGLRVGVMFLLSANLNGALKLLFHAPRPAWLDAKIVAQAVEPSFGFPSGHAQNGMAVWGLLASHTKSRLVWGAALVLAVFIGLSRLALQVHFPGDVLGGWLIGALLLGAFLKLEKPVGNWLKKLDFVQHIVVCGLLSGLFIFCNRIGDLFAAHENFFPQIQAFLSYPETSSKAAGALFGFLVGACWMLRNGGYVDSGNKVLRYVIGVLGVAFFWFGLGKFLPRGEDFVSLGAAYMRYALVGFWISAGAPMVFRKIEKTEVIA